VRTIIHFEAFVAQARKVAPTIIKKFKRIGSLTEHITAAFAAGVILSLAFAIFVFHNAFLPEGGKRYEKYSRIQMPEEPYCCIADNLR
jgi:hypothetical protein